VFMAACQPAEKANPAKERFEANSQTVLKILEGWQNENVDYSLYADNFRTISTAYGATDSIDLATMKENDARTLGALDFEILTDPITLLPGVNVDTKEMDGSVRLYSYWKVTRPATDSTEARSGNLRIYQAWVFNEEGKVAFSFTFGDFGGLNKALWGNEDEMSGDDDMDK